MSKLRRPLHRKPERGSSPPSFSSPAQVPCRFGDLLSEIDHVDACITVIWDKNARSDARYALAGMQQHQIGWAMCRWLDDGNGGSRRRCGDGSTRERRITRTMWRWVGGGTGDWRGDCVEHRGLLDAALRLGGYPRVLLIVALSVPGTHSGRGASCAGRASRLGDRLRRGDSPLRTGARIARQGRRPRGDGALRLCLLPCRSWHSDGNV